MVEPGADVSESQEHPDAPGRISSRGVDALICLALVLATIAAYAQVWRCAFVNFDDGIYVIYNPNLRDGFTLQSLRWVLFSFQPDNWFPVTRLSHLVDFTFFGEQSAYHHVVSLFFHVLASLLLYGFLRGVLGIGLAPEAELVNNAGRPFVPGNMLVNRWIAGFSAFLFALHPLHVESVAWVSERKDVLCAVFWFAALWAWVGWVKRPSRLGYFLAAFLFGLGLMSKPMIVTFPVLLLLLDVWPLRRPNSLAARLSWAPIREKIPFFAMSVIASGLTWLAQSSGGALRPIEVYGIAMRIENALTTPWVYIGKTIYPVGLSAIYEWPARIPIWQAIAGGISLSLVSFMVLRQRNDRPWLAVGWFWFLATLLPVIGLIQFGNQIRADRYMYVPMAGLGLMAAVSVVDFLASRPAWRRPTAILACIALAVFLGLTRRQVAYWQDSESLFGHAIQLDPENYLAHFMQGNTISNIPGQQFKAIDSFEHAIRLKPDFVEAREKLAHMLCAAGLTIEGLSEFEETLRARPHYALANFDLGYALVKLGRVVDAVPRFREAVVVEPRNPQAQMALGIALENLPGGLPEAVAHLDQALRLEPANPVSHYQLGVALANSEGRLAEAIHHFEAAIETEPTYAAAHYNLGKALLRNPDTISEANSHLRLAEQFEPNAEVRLRWGQLGTFPPDTNQP